jgi:hypothetical protein
MCFNDNVGFFKLFNVAFFIVHAVLLLACIITYSIMDGNLPVYYKIEISHDQTLNVKLLVVPIIMHSVAMLFHFVFFIKGGSIVEITIPKNFTNPYHWYYQFVVDGMAFVGVMLIHGFHQIETIALVIALFAAIVVLCFYQDQYMNRDGMFLPTVSPHSFAIPLYICMIMFIAFKSTEHINEPDRVKIAIITSMTLFQTGLMFIIQKFHINYNKLSDLDDLKGIIKNESAVEQSEEGEELTMPIDSTNELLDMEIAELRRAIKYDLMHYLNSIIFHIAVTWIIINLTRNGQDLG